MGHLRNWVILQVILIVVIDLSENDLVCFDFLIQVIDLFLNIVLPLHHFSLVSPFLLFSFLIGLLMMEYYSSLILLIFSITNHDHRLTALVRHVPFETTLFTLVAPATLLSLVKWLSTGLLLDSRETAHSLVNDRLTHARVLKFKLLSPTRFGGNSSFLHVSLNHWGVLWAGFFLAIIILFNCLFYIHLEFILE